MFDEHSMPTGEHWRHGHHNLFAGHRDQRLSDSLGIIEHVNHSLVSTQLKLMDLGITSPELNSTDWETHSNQSNGSSAFMEGANKYNSTYESHELFAVPWQVVVILLYSLTAALALVGNVIAIWVLVQGKRCKELRSFLVNLSLTDVTMAVFSIPFTYTNYVLGRWIFYPSFCPLVQMMQIVSVFVSIYTLTAIGIDRYMAIMFPLFIKSARLNRALGRFVLGFIWACGLALGLVQWANTAATPITIANEPNTYCTETWRTASEVRTYTLCIFVVTFAFPLAVLSFAYGSVCWKMFRHSTPGNVDVERDRSQHKSKSKIIKMLCCIVVLFAICWLPIHILNILITFARETMNQLYNDPVGKSAYIIFTIAAHWLSMANSFMNPIIYCFFSANFRSDLQFLMRRAVRRWCPCLQSNMLRPRSKSMMLTTRSSQPTYHTSVGLSRAGTSTRVASSANGYRQGERALCSRQCSALSTGSGTDKEDPTLSASGGRTEWSSGQLAREASEWSEDTGCTAASATPSTTHSLSSAQCHKICGTRRTSCQSDALTRADHSRLDQAPTTFHSQADDHQAPHNCLPAACCRTPLVSLVHSHSLPPS